MADGYWEGAGRGAAARQTFRFVSFCSLFSVSIILFLFPFMCGHNTDRKKGTKFGNTHLLKQDSGVLESIPECGIEIRTNWLSIGEKCC